MIEKQENKDSIKELIKFVLKIYKKDKEIDYNKLQEELNNKFRSGSMLVENIIKFEKKVEQRGIEKGRIEGIEKGKIEVARNFKKLGIDIRIISQATGLSIEEIEKL